MLSKIVKWYVFSGEELKLFFLSSKCPHLCHNNHVIRDIALCISKRKIHLLPSRSYFLHLFLYLCFTGTHRIDCFLNQVI